MVAASEYGYLELLLTRALPDHQLKFRCLAWEGDTVFEQPRMLNYPTLEQQLDQIGATVVIAQFGQMESLAGKEKLPEFIAAYEKLIERVNNGKEKRIFIQTPTPLDRKPKSVRGGSLWTPEQLEAHRAYEAGAIKVATERKWRFLHTQFYLSRWSKFWPSRDEVKEPSHAENFSSDGVHMVNVAHWLIARNTLLELANRYPYYQRAFDGAHRRFPAYGEDRETLALITAKNRLWFHYYRPQNWAFLAGDRTKQPSSRDHLDPTKRWFPEEMEKFLPLIEAKEREIWALAKKLAEEK